MSDYSRQEDFSVKDALTTGDPDKVIKGSEVDSEFDALVTAVATKIDVLSGHTTNDIVYLNSVGKLVDAGILYTDVAQISGTTFTGAVVLAADPTAALGAATKQYVDNIVAISNTTDSAVATGTTVIPLDNTIPTSTEGDEYITVSHTPQKTTHKLLIQAQLQVSHSVLTTVAAALFQDAGGSAIAVSAHGPRTGTQIMQISLSHVMTAGTTSSTTFKLRAGGAGAGTLTLNGQSGSRLFGGVFSSSLSVTEYVA